MSRNTIGLIWVGGLLGAVLLTVVGPGTLGTELGLALDRLVDSTTLALAQVGDPLREMIRGFAIATYGVFIALCVVARRRHLPSMATAVAVTLVFLFLVGSPRGWDRSLHGAHWLLALLLNLAASLLMTRRLAGWPPGGGAGRRFGA